jgi:peptidoglycan/xylan/chitin deacetylase (PgdA/CDA1 family)
MHRPKWPRNSANAVAAILLASMACTAAVEAADCPRKGTLGISRILGVDAATTPHVGLKSFSETLPLDDHEVVLTFDDGPWPRTTTLVLSTLAQECVQATFFLIGKNASEHPELVQKNRHRTSHHRPSHLVASQSDANPAEPDPRGNRPRHIRE